MLKITKWASKIAIHAISFYCPYCNNINFYDTISDECNICKIYTPNPKKILENANDRLSFFNIK